MSARFPQFKMNYAVSGESVSNLKEDVKEARTCFENAAYKATMLLCGSVLENVLLDYLSTDEWLAEQAYTQTMGRNPPSSLEDWSLDNMLQVSRRLRLISDETYRLCDLLRNYRNLIHPAVARRTSMHPNRTRAQRSLEAIRQALENLDSSFASVWQNVYIVNISSVTSCFINSKSVLQTAIVNLSQQHGLSTHVISSFAGMQRLLQNPPRYVIIVNTHGEIMPVPQGRDWRNFYIDIGDAVKTHGWIFINIGGYPFYYERQNQTIGVDGLNALLSVSHISANCMNPANVSFTSEGTRMINLASMTGLPHSLVASRCARWQGVSQKIVFLKTRDLCGASAIRMGRGWFIHLGLDSSLGNPNPTPQHLTLGDTILGNLGIASAMYVADKLS